MINNTDFAYAAGYIDGDGCFHIRKQFIKNRLSPKLMGNLVISSVNKDILDWFKQSFSGTVFKAKQKESLKIKRHKPLYYYSIRKRDGVPFVINILPFLVEKREEAQLFIDFSHCSDLKQADIFIQQIKTLKNDINLVRRDMKEEFEKNRNTIIPTQEDFAYLAGLIDAEACFGINRYKDKNKPNFLYKITLMLNNTKAPVFKWLLERFGGTIHFKDRSKYINHKDQMQWQLSSKSLANILNDIYPFLKYKQPVCKELIRFYETKVPSKIGRKGEAYRALSFKIIEEREHIFHRIHILNQKGISHLSG